MSKDIPKFIHRKDAVKCGVCFGVVKPGLLILQCTCGKRYHASCAKRVGTCTSCGRSYDDVDFSKEAMSDDGGAEAPSEVDDLDIDLDFSLEDLDEELDFELD